MAASIHVLIFVCQTLLASLPAQALQPTCSWAGRTGFSGVATDFEDLGFLCPTTFGGGAVSLSFDVSVSTPHYSRIIDFGDADYTMNIFVVIKNDGNFIFQANNRGRVDVDGNPFDVLTKPFHIFWVLAETESRVYLNGVLVGTQAINSGIARENRTLLVAKSHQSGTPLFKGDVTNFKLWDGAEASCADTGGCTWTSSTTSSTSATGTSSTSSRTSSSTSSISLSTSSSSLSSSSTTSVSSSTTSLSTLTSTSSMTVSSTSSKTISSTSSSSLSTSSSSAPSSSTTSESTLTSTEVSTTTVSELPSSSAAVTTAASESSTMTSSAGEAATTAELARSSETVAEETTAATMADVTSTVAGITSRAEGAGTSAPATVSGVTSTGALTDSTPSAWSVDAASTVPIAITESPVSSSAAPPIATTQAVPSDANASPDTSSAGPTPGTAAGTSSMLSPATDVTSAELQSPPHVTTTPVTDSSLPNATSLPSTSSFSADVVASTELGKTLLHDEQDMLKDLGGKSEFTGRLPGVTTAAFALDSSAAAASVSVAGWHMTVPMAGFFEPGAAVSATASIPDPGTLPEISPDFAPLALASFNLYKNGTRLAVKGLSEPIVITVPVEDPSNVSSIVYWDEEELQWLGRGIAMLERGTDMVRFSTTHLTLFAAVWQGFVSTLACAHLGMLSLEGLRALWSSEWYYGHVALLFWEFLLFLLLTLVLACHLDSLEESWSDKVFLIPEEVVPETQGLRSSASALVRGNAMRDALDEICSIWMEYFGELRELLESMCSGLSCKNISLTQFGIMLGRMVGEIVAETARRNACGSLNLSDEVVSLVLEDEDIGQVLMEAALRSRKEDAPQCLKSWLEMHEKVLGGVDRHWRQGLGYYAAVRLFQVSQPVFACFKPCPLTKRSMRMMLLVCDILGQMTLAALFFEGSGMATNKKAVQSCEAELAGFGGLVGRMIAIVLVSALLANLPVRLLASLHHRGCVKVAHEGCPKWHRQLHIWRLQDRLLWAMAGLYSLSCVFFLLLFLANISPRDLGNFGVTALLQLLQNLLVLPFVISMVLPLLRTLSLCALSRAQHRPPAHILAEQRLAKEGTAGNWKYLIASI